MRIILLGNSGSGKTSMARQIVNNQNIPILSLDEVAWNAGPARKPIEESTKLLQDFIDAHEHWVIEGCYGDLVEAILPFCSELRFLNPGIETCVKHCQLRPWEPDKFDSEKEQRATLDYLISWVKMYEERDDEYGLKKHRKVFDSFNGVKKEYLSVSEYNH
ncbi:hypothetical protein V6R21_31635 [Limibacter armeniacum]|uniref:hypothetical protein n=1 Tax=Limibacter armeniacum TaxID=466084 RepID=UPI002FE6796C